MNAEKYRHIVESIGSPAEHVRIVGRQYMHRRGIRRVTLESYVVQDAEGIFQLIHRNRAHFEKFDGPWTKTYQHPDNVIDTILDKDNLDRYRFTIRDNNNTIVGGINLERCVTHSDHGMVGYFVDQAQTHNGYASHALSLLIAYGYSDLGINVFNAEIHPENSLSICTAQKCGFTDQGPIASLKDWRLFMLNM